MKLPEMKTGLTISAMIHAALLLWGIISFAAKPLEAKPNDALPVDIISDKQFSELTKGVKNAPKDKPPAPLVEKVGDPKPVDDSSAKVTEKKELLAAKTDATPPPPAGAMNGASLKVVLRVVFKPDATVALPPELVAASNSPFGPAMAESAKRAILTCQPFTMLRADHYQLWKDIEITFDPREMFGG